MAPIPMFTYYQLLLVAVGTVWLLAWLSYKNADHAESIGKAVVPRVRYVTQSACEQLHRLRQLADKTDDAAKRLQILRRTDMAVGTVHTLQSIYGTRTVDRVSGVDTRQALSDTQITYTMLNAPPLKRFY
jgi:hypothetical protein